LWIALESTAVDSGDDDLSFFKMVIKMHQKDDNTDNIPFAVLCALTAHFLFSMMGFGAKYLTDEYHVTLIVFIRNLIVFVPFLIFMLRSKNRHLFKTNKPRLVIFRALVGSVSLIVTFYALAILPMSYAAVLFFTSTILTPIIAAFVLKELVGIHRIMAVIIGMIGVAIVSHPSGEVSVWGVILALCAAFMHATMFVTLRSLKSESPLTVTFYFVFAGMVFPALFLPLYGAVPSYDVLWIFVVVGISGGIAQLCLANAYKYAPASVVTPFAYSSLIWTVLIDIFFWNYDLDFWAVSIGTALIMGAQFYIIHREYVNKRRKARP